MARSKSLLNDLSHALDLLESENDRLLDDNARLQGIVTNDELRMQKVLVDNANLRELVTFALKHIIEFECEEPDRERLRGKPCEDCVDYGSSDCPKCMPRMFDVSEIEVDE